MVTVDKLCKENSCVDVPQVILCIYWRGGGVLLVWEVGGEADFCSQFVAVFVCHSRMLCDVLQGNGGSSAGGVPGTGN